MEFQYPLIKLYWNTALLIHFVLSMDTFRELNSYNIDCGAKMLTILLSTIKSY